MESFNYLHQYNLLRRYANEWDIAYTRYSHDQLRQAMATNGGKADVNLRKHLLSVIPVNGYYQKKNPAKAEPHDPALDELGQAAASVRSIISAGI